MLAAPTLQKKIYTDCTLLENPRVRGSIPRLGTIIQKPRSNAGLCCFWLPENQAQFPSANKIVILRPSLGSSLLFISGLASTDLTLMVMVQAVIRLISGYTWQDL